MEIKLYIYIYTQDIYKKCN